MSTEAEEGTEDIPVGSYTSCAEISTGVELIDYGERPGMVVNADAKRAGSFVERRKAYKYQSLAYNFMMKNGALLGDR